MHFVLEHLGVHAGVLQHKETLIPGGIIAHVLRDQFVNVDQLIVEEALIYGIINWNHSVYGNLCSLTPT